MNIHEWYNYCRALRKDSNAEAFEDNKRCKCDKCDPFICCEFLDGFGYTCPKSIKFQITNYYAFPDPFENADMTIEYWLEIDKIKNRLTKRLMKQPIQLTLFEL